MPDFLLLLDLLVLAVELEVGVDPEVVEVVLLEVFEELAELELAGAEPEVVPELDLTLLVEALLAGAEPEAVPELELPLLVEALLAGDEPEAFPELELFPLVVEPAAVAAYATSGYTLLKGNDGEEQPMQGTLALIHQLTPLFHLRLGQRLMLSVSLPWQPKFQKQPV